MKTQIPQLTKLMMLTAFTVFTRHIANAQNTFPSTGSAGIGTTTPDASSKLEIKSTTRGFLAPRMNQTQRNAIGKPATGLLIYQIDNTPGFYYYTGSVWKAVSASATAGANTSLSNLSLPTAVNRDLLPAANATNDLGAFKSGWRNEYLTGTLFSGEVQATSSGNFTAVLGTAANGIAVSGTSNGTSATSYGVAGYNSNNIGVYGSGFWGVYGSGYTGVLGIGNEVGVEGSSNSGPGVIGGSTDNAGLLGSSTNNYGVIGESFNSASYAGYFQGSVYSTGNYQGSDKSLKQNIRDFASAINIINQLHPTQYEFRQDGNYKLMMLPTGSHYGLIAQEVEKILPNLIKETTFDPAMTELKKTGTQAKPKSDTIKFKALNYTELIPIMIKGMQELSGQTDSLKNINIKQEKINADLQNQINVLKAMIASNQSVINNSSAIIITNNNSLAQNIPNPFTNTTSIGYSLKQKFTSAQIVITDKNGKVLKSINVSGNGKGTLNVDAATLASGAYNYSLLADGKLIATKQMVLTK